MTASGSLSCWLARVAVWRRNLSQWPFWRVVVEPSPDEKQWRPHSGRWCPHHRSPSPDAASTSAEGHEANHGGPGFITLSLNRPTQGFGLPLLSQPANARSLVWHLAGSVLNEVSCHPSPARHSATVLACWYFAVSRVNNSSSRNGDIPRDITRYAVVFHSSL